MNKKSFVLKCLWALFLPVFEAFQNIAYLKVFLSHSLLLIVLGDRLRDGGNEREQSRKVWRGRGRGRQSHQALRPC